MILRLSTRRKPHIPRTPMPESPATGDRLEHLIATLSAGLAVDIHELLTNADRAVLLRLALGNPDIRAEHRYRNIHTGRTVRQLDLRVHDFADWVPEQRTVIETAWRTYS